MRYRFVAEHQREYPVKTMCRILDVSESGYSAWKKRAPSQGSLQDTALGERMAQASHSNRQVYGSPRIHAVLRRQGVACGRKQVAWIMRQAGLLPGAVSIVAARPIVSMTSQWPTRCSPAILRRVRPI